MPQEKKDMSLFCRSEFRNCFTSAKQWSNFKFRIPWKKAAGSVRQPENIHHLWGSINNTSQ